MRSAIAGDVTRSRKPVLRVACVVALAFTLCAATLKAGVTNASVRPRVSCIRAPSDIAAARTAWEGPSTLGCFVHKMVDGRAICLEAGAEQARRLKDRDADAAQIILTPFPDPSGSPRTGLKIVLRGTPRLMGFPDAIEGFKRAAAQWEVQIQTVMTVVIDVDYGPTAFGKPLDDDVVATCDAQVLGGNCFYPAVQANLISGPYSIDKKSLYGSLPLGLVPTDKGEYRGLVASSATLRALDLINPAADADGEMSDFGMPPAIGFNSKSKLDFNPDDGIDPDKLDFLAMALHEIGHVLGFISSAGQQEMNPLVEAQPSLWDLFRLRSDTSTGGFTSAQRILSSGGDQSFFAAGLKLALSTGRPDGAGGDGRQASHWKDDDLTGQYIGVMDPTIWPGEHQYLTDNDLEVIDDLGYRAKSLFDPTTVVALISGLPQTGSLFAPPPGLEFLCHIHYSLVVPRGATQLRIELRGNTDVDLFARFARPVVNQTHAVLADYRSATPASSETIVVTSSSSPALTEGIYYAAVANFGPGDADFTVTAAFSGGVIGRAPAGFNIKADLESDLLTLDCAAADRDGDLARADVTILNEGGRVVSPPSSFAINPRGSIRSESRLTINLSGAPTAQRASVGFTDRLGNRSAGATIDFGKAGAGAIALNSASFNGAKLTMKVGGPVSGLQLEINGRVVAPPLNITVKGSGNKLMVKGDASQLNLRSGPNRIRIRNVNGWSNIFILSN